MIPTPHICHPGPAGPGRSSGALELWDIVPHTRNLASRTCWSWQELNSAQQHWSCGRLVTTPHICHPGPANPSRSSAALQLWQIVPHTQHLPSRTCRSWQELNSTQQHWSYGRLLPTPNICHPRSAGPGRSSAMLVLWDIVPHTRNLASRTCWSWQELNSTQQHWSCGRLLPTPNICHPGSVGPGRSSAMLVLWDIVPHTGILHPGPAGPGRSSTTLNNTGAVADCFPHPTSVIQDLQVLEGAQQCWSYGRLFPTLEIWHPGPAGLGRSSTALSNTGAVADCSPHPTSAIQDLQVLEGAQQCWSCGRLFPTLEIWHPGPASLGRTSTALSSTRAMANCSPHPTSIIRNLQVLTRHF